jgi:hypothetical protein
MIYWFLHLLASVSVTDPTLREDRMAKVDVLGRSCGDGCRCCFDEGELGILGSRERMREGDAQHALDQISVWRKGGSTSSPASSSSSSGYIVVRIFDTLDMVEKASSASALYRTVSPMERNETEIDNGSG